MLELSQNETEIPSPNGIEGLNSDLKLIPLKDILPDPNNPRVHTEENVLEIANSIKTLGFNNPLQVVPLPAMLPGAPQQYKIVAGHGRYLALEHLNVKVAPCYILKHLEGDSARAMAANIADNEIALHSFYDDDKLAIALNDLQSVSEDLLSVAGFDMDKFMDAVYGNELTEEDAFELNDVTKNDFVKQINQNDDTTLSRFQDENLRPKDIFVLKSDHIDHKILYGDCTDAMQMEELCTASLASEAGTHPLGGLPTAVNMLITDNRPKLKKETDKQYVESLTEQYGIAKNLLDIDNAPGGVWYILTGNDTLYQTLIAIDKAGLHLRENLVWVTNGLQISGKYDYRLQHEPILYGGVDETGFSPYMHQDILYGFEDKRIKSWNNDGKQPSVISVDSKSNTKPIKLVGYFMKNHTKPSARILDLLVGNGTTLIACEQLGRQYLGVDGDKDNIVMALMRYATYTHYDRPIINTRTKEDMREKLKKLQQN